ncbi:Isoaspartyl peptidase/L-asparaginase [Labeo rohita]|uniref:Isoaspartyl peptidase/L-asparaginase n=1 Tax=Labeo rohita TaxID=84645 RepID=A0ABQ8M4G2_LABRO|nr:Isoaspartyl peptidase/L-asparaginase [Labeo rohita]
MKTVIVVHGGAWAIPDMLAEASVAGVKNAVQAGDAVLKNGHGAVLNIIGEVELDSIIMDGKTLATGAVASVRNIANPTDHVMLTDRGASMFAEHIGIPAADDLVTELEREDWEKSNTYKVGVKTGHDTVGAVALDSLGNVACATSTGGNQEQNGGKSRRYSYYRIWWICRQQKWRGLLYWPRRVYSQRKSATAAADASLQYMGERVKGCGGAIVVSSAGDWAANFTTQRMAWASIKEDIMHYGLNPKEDFTEKLK